MRMIDADYIMWALGIFNDRINGDEHFLNGINTARVIVENAPTIGGWISVKDRLPEDGTTYLCYQPNVWHLCAINTVRWSTEKNRWMGKEVDSEIHGITHWMVLPKPPKGET